MAEGCTFEFRNPGPLVDDELLLVLAAKVPAVPEKNHVPAYLFEMRHLESGDLMGTISLRIGFNENIYYGGNIGYRVEESYRGAHRAARSVGLLFELARTHGLKELWATCNPDNIASRKTCEAVGGTLVGIVDIPEHNEMYARGERQKCRYRFEL